ncbi:hypothetical protein L6654_24775 [Bradyrhizobium sp. WYCCWR 13023]|uniref:Uncharacterized protein n=1 Tax=Bradyrhizobium zhengyangense TaxID=2911009 RepID=A0A9X1RGN2_9BRAD|nr:MULTISPECIES: hypothetical protein [Bradyrhizobium]MCG2629845.1 hypothetical protein [Bradyrhizobium zhengyangense]MCG2642425.1 hypothetical protein [Bradyrhizobium zhengyangense]MCG2667663.1 hypothetical protein [Bradyrhizobium zhengyangense]
MAPAIIRLAKPIALRKRFQDHGLVKQHWSFFGLLPGALGVLRKGLSGHLREK